MLTTRKAVVPINTKPSIPKRKSNPGLSNDIEVIINDDTKTGIAHRMNL